jgi:hypothetical protein
VPDWSSSDSSIAGFATLYQPPQYFFPPTIDNQFLEDGRLLEVSGVYLDAYERHEGWKDRQVITSTGFCINTRYGGGGVLGDEIWVLHGAPGLAILRPRGTHFLFLQEATFANWQYRNAEAREYMDTDARLVLFSEDLEAQRICLV